MPGNELEIIMIRLEQISVTNKQYMNVYKVHNIVNQLWISRKSCHHALTRDYKKSFYILFLKRQYKRRYDRDGTT